VNGPVPPVTVTVADPLFPPPQLTFVCVVESVNAADEVIVTECVERHPLTSVTVTVYDPAHKPEAVAALPPDGAQLYV